MAFALFLKKNISAFIISGMLFGISNSVVISQEQSLELGLPIDCTLGEDCFIQQMTDMDVSTGIADPYCSIVSYDGHKGTDIRVRRLTDMDTGFKVLAAAGGIVRGIRNNVADNLVKTRKDREKIKDKECGNGVFLDHGNGIETQYCHLKRGSVRVKSGEIVQKGDVLGLVGLSGFTQFPHVHLSVRKNGNVLDPFTGRMPEDGCDVNGKTWWDDDKIIDAAVDTQLLDAGITGDLIKHQDMVIRRPKDLAIDNDKSIGWVWYANLHKNDRIFIDLRGPDGPLGQSLSDPLNRNKASWSGFVGKKRIAKMGRYILETHVLRGEEKLNRQVKVFEVK